MTRREMLRRMDSRELSEWQALYRISPWGEERADLRVALLTSLLANVYRKEGTPLRSPADFMPFSERAEQTPEEQVRVLSGLAGPKRDSSPPAPAGQGSE